MITRRPMWQITIADKTNTRVIFHACCEDRKECAALATEARSQSLDYKIWIKPPADVPADAWD